MNNINRRKFLEKFLLYSGTISFGANFPYLSTLFLPSGADYYLPIQPSNPCIIRNEKKCKGCRACIEPCKEKQIVYGTYKSSKTNHLCIHCGACIKTCEKGALSEKYHYQEVFNAINDPSKIVIASISPSVPAGIGDCFGIHSGSYLPGNIVGACKALGFDYVLDTNFSADLTIMEESRELQERIEEKSDLPQFTSCCPAWVRYVEIYYPSLLKHLSTTRSPVIMQGSIVKSYFAKKKGIDPKNIIHVAITPCSAKKYEIIREELTTDGMRCTDVAITTNELAIMIKNRNIDLANTLGTYDSFMGSSSGGGMIFGNSGGVTSAALRTAHYNITGKNLSADMLDFKQLQGLSGLKEATIQIRKSSLNVAVCYEMRNAKVLLDQVMNGSCKYHFIEVMACEGGCIGGAGQPSKNINLESRMSALNNADSKAATRFCHENPEVRALYKHFLGRVGSSNAKKYLHTSFNNKSGLLFYELTERKLEPAV